MWNRSSLKVLVVIALGIASACLTARLSPFLQKARAGMRSDQVPPEVQTSIREEPNVPGNPAGRVAGRKSVAGGAMRSMKVEAEAKTFHVTASGSLRDSRPGMQFVWSLRVLDPEDETTILWEKIYDNQVFKLPETGEMDMNFEDRLDMPLPAGKYVLELTWFGIHPATGIEGLQDPILKQRYQGASGRTEITIDP